jgi:hypothetical protein
LSISETLLIFVGVPAAIVALVAILVYGGSARRARRYRPGRPFTFTPVWFLAVPAEQGPGGTARAAVTAGPQGGAARRELVAAQAQLAGRGETGGASDRW